MKVNVKAPILDFMGDAIPQSKADDSAPATVGSVLITMATAVLEGDEADKAALFTIGLAAATGLKSDTGEAEFTATEAAFIVKRVDRMGYPAVICGRIKQAIDPVRA